MVQGPSPELLESIRHPTSLDAHIASLKQLKNGLIGHDQRKELAIKRGVADILVPILTAPTKAAGKKRSTNGSLSGGPLQTAPPAWTAEYEVRLQATVILGILANGGSPFVQPLLAAGAGNALAQIVAEDEPPRLVTATLKALQHLARSAALINRLPFEPTALEEDLLPSLLKSALLNTACKEQQKLAADIIVHLADQDEVKDTLAKHLLETLARLLAASAIANRHVDYHRPLSSHLSPAPPNTTIPYILAAIIGITTGSIFRMQSFIHSSPIRDLFQTAWAESNPANSSLPQLHVPVYKTVSFSPAFPVLGSLPQEHERDSSYDGAQAGRDASYANAVIGWLIVLARSLSGRNRIAALLLLAQVNQAIDEEYSSTKSRPESTHRHRERERQLATLAIPLAVQLIQGTTPEERTMAASLPTSDTESREVQGDACDALAILIEDSKILQNAAVEAGAIKRICPILKQSFDTITPARPMWVAHPPGPDEADLPESCKLGIRGLPAEIYHTMRMRASALQALAALASREDIHKKVIVEAGVVSCIIDSLKPFTPEVTAAIEGRSKPLQQFSTKDGNGPTVIQAACLAAKCISRSVSLLRTSLIDAGIAKPIFELLQHTKPEVQLAATDVCCNLLLDFSPMRDDLLAAGVIKTLTEHARQSEMGLRLASLWALKHLVQNSPKDVKIQCLDELGVGWLVGAIQGEQGSAVADPASFSMGGVSVAGGGFSTPNAAGEQVDLLNPNTNMDIDEQADEDEALDEGDEEEEDEDEDGEVMYDEAAGIHYQASQLRSTLHRSPDDAFAPSVPEFNSARYLASVREKEYNPVLQAKQDDIAVQEQALDFVRNLLHGEDCAFMFEHLLRAIGQDKLFSLLNDKLAPITAPSPLLFRGAPLPQPTKPLYQSTELILSTVHVLTHIANASATHKQLLMAQKHLLAHWLPHFNHPDKRVRVISVWAVNSLTWVEDEGDRTTAQLRVKELRSCGIENAIRGLANDPELDVRERVKTAVRQMDGL